MEKQDWESLYKVLEGIYSRFRDDYQEAEYGSNKKIREASFKKAQSGVDRACFHIEKDIQAYKLLTGADGVNDYSRAINYDEFKQPRYFQSDMPKFLQKILSKINSYGQEGRK